MRLWSIIFAALVLLLTFPIDQERLLASAASAAAERQAEETAGQNGREPVPEPANIASESAILIDQESGLVLFAKNAFARMYPASITKIVTAIVAIETSELDETVTVSKEARNEDGTRVYLSEGEQKTMEQMLYAMMLNSGNDAATAIAEHIDGSKALFAERMNEFVRDVVGVHDSNFVNPSGLPDENHYTTAYDMAQIARYAMRNETFRTIVSTVRMPWDGLEWKSTLINHNRLLTSYEGATGIKNGYTRAAGNTLASSATRGDKSLIGVVLKAPSSNQAYKDMTALFDYGFAAFQSNTLFAKGETYTEEEGDTTREWVAQQPIRVLARSGDQPHMSVDSQGQVMVENDFGPQKVGQLEPVKTQVHAMRSEEAAAMPETEKEAATSSPYAIWMPAAGIVVAAAAVWAAAKRRKRDRDTSDF